MRLEYYEYLTKIFSNLDAKFADFRDCFGKSELKICAPIAEFLEFEHHRRCNRAKFLKIRSLLCAHPNSAVNAAGIVARHRNFSECTIQSIGLEYLVIRVVK